ncbi:MAG TPA: transglutaminase domain-containing protein [Beutenbergiaceae bacterium]|nr:transglutaminase domain-containing protein [Beutenbergiaceae bacterium]
MDVSTYAAHSSFSDPGAHRPLLAAVPPDTPSLHTAVMRTVLHYRNQTHPLTPRQLADIDNRWVERICSTAVERRPGPLTQERPAAEQVGGCCRDHVLLAVAILREHGIPARSRVGFAGYLNPGFHHDHVVAERWSAQQQRWIRFDPEFAAGDLHFDVHDIPCGPDGPFQTAAQAWLAYRAGHTDLSTYGVGPHLPQLGGPGFVQRYLLLDLAHLMGAETLLWDVWGLSAGDRAVDRADAVGDPGGGLSGLSLAEPDAELFEASDTLARMIMKADDGDRAASETLTGMWTTQAGLRPGRQVWTISPSGRVGLTDLRTRRTEWRPGSHPSGIPVATR